MNKTEEKIDNILVKKMKESLLEVPSSDFTSRVLDQIEVEAATATAKASTTYVPLISKNVWYGIAAVFLVLILFSSTEGSEVSQWSSTLTSIKSEVGSWNINPDFWSLQIPTSLVYGVVIFSALLLIEIPILKKQLYR